MLAIMHDVPMIWQCKTFFAPNRGNGKYVADFVRKGIKINAFENDSS